MRNLTAALCLTIAVLLGSVGVSQSCQKNVDTSTQLSEFLRNRPNNVLINTNDTNNTNKIIGYLNILSDKFDSSCRTPIVMLHEDGFLFVIKDWDYVLDPFFKKYCSSPVLHQTQGIRLLSEIPEDPPVGVNEIEQFAKRCKVQITGKFPGGSIANFFPESRIVLIHRDDEIFKKIENRTETRP